MTEQEMVEMAELAVGGELVSWNIVDGDTISLETSWANFVIRCSAGRCEIISEELI